MSSTSGVVAEATGLTSAEVAQRVHEGKVNVVDDTSSRSLSDIVRSNVLTRFNLVIAILAGIVLALGEYRDALFSLVMVSNAAIGVIQELRSKATLDRLSLVAAPQLTVMRDGVPTTLRSEQVVLGDVIQVGLGDQIVVDGEVIQTDALSIDESLLTGEADAVDKTNGDGLLSGSFVVAGRGLMRATAVGDDSYAARLARQAKEFRPPQSELERGINSILRVVTWLIVPAGVGLFLAQRYGQGDSVHDSLLGTVAGVVALVPQGLVLFLSMAQAVAVIRLGRAGVLVQRLEAVETLARVTLLATDKTGTLTSGAVVLDHVQSLDESLQIDDALGAVAGIDEHPDPTMAAIVAIHPKPQGWAIAERVPFSSAYKYSAVDFGDNGVWYIGAPEVLLREGSEVLESVQRAADQGMRVLVLAKGSELAAPGELPASLEPSALVVCTDEIRPDAAETVSFFVQDKVTVKVISGDNPRTVSAIAARCEVPGSENWVDGRTLPGDLAELAGHVSSTTVFGRVTPEVKRSLVQAAQQQGEVVAMTGDGVNDTLALKDADLGIAMGSGTPAAKSVAELVLLNNEFSTLPGVVAEGRRVIANIERVAPAVRDEDDLGGDVRGDHRRVHHDLPVAAAAADGGRCAHDRHPRVHPQLRAEPRTDPGRLRASGDAVLRAGRPGGRRGDDDRLRGPEQFARRRRPRGGPERGDAAPHDPRSRGSLRVDAAARPPPCCTAGDDGGDADRRLRHRPDRRLLPASAAARR